MAVDKGVPTDGALAPLRYRAFRWLWIALIVSSVGAWAQTVGAQWLFINDPNAATIIPLVQTASALPAMLLAFPAGVIADAFDRRWLLLGVQIYFVVVVSLAVLTFLGQMTPPLLLGFTSLIGAGLAVQIPTWQPLIAELVPRKHLPAASRLDMVNVNVARALGPLIAGLIIARWGVPPVFVFNALCATLLIVALVAWRRKPSSASLNRERFLPAIRAGGRYVRHEPVVRRILLRLLAFVFPATALWALLPLLASQRFGLHADGYGLLFAALGLGAITAALTLGRLKSRLSSNRLVAYSALAFGASFGLTVVVPGLLPAIPLLFVAGYAWSATASTLNAELQLFLPAWVRARALAANMMVFMGAQAVASPIWGLVTQFGGLTVAVVAASVLVALGSPLGWLMKVPDTAHLDRSTLKYWNDVALSFDPEPNAGPIVVSIDYEVAAENEAGFLNAMDGMRRSRLRNGSSRWELYRVAEEPHRYVEQFVVSSWEEHLLQHEGRLTAADQLAEKAAFAFATGEPRARHLLPPASDPEAEDLDPA